MARRTISTAKRKEGKDHWALKKMALGIVESAKHCRECVQMPCMEACPRKIRIAQKIQEIERLVHAYL